MEQLKRKPRSAVRLADTQQHENINSCPQPPVPLKLNLQRTLLAQPGTTRVAVKDFVIVLKLIAVPAVPRRFHHALP